MTLLMLLFWLIVGGTLQAAVPAATVSATP